jgi:hypothetical protein
MRHDLRIGRGTVLAGVAAFLAVTIPPYAARAAAVAIATPHMGWLMLWS